MSAHARRIPRHLRWGPKKLANYGDAFLAMLGHAGGRCVAAAGATFGVLELPSMRFKVYRALDGERVFGTSPDRPCTRAPGRPGGRAAQRLADGLLHPRRTTKPRDECAGAPKWTGSIDQGGALSAFFLSFCNSFSSFNIRTAFSACFI